MRAEGPGFFGGLGIFGGSNHETRILTSYIPSSLARRSSQHRPQIDLSMHPLTIGVVWPPHKRTPITRHESSIRYQGPIQHSLSLVDWPRSCASRALWSLCSLLMHRFLGNLWALSAALPAAPVCLSAKLPSGVTTIPLIIFELRGPRR
jgi:hypothetical protein